jgi:hypothetical protein
MNPLDRKLSKVLKSAKRNDKSKNLERDYAQQIRSRIIDKEFAALVDQLVTDFAKSPSDPKSTQQVIGIIQQLRSREFVESAAVVAKEWFQSLTSLNLSEIISTAPDASSFDNWCKKTNTKLPILEELLQKDPRVLYNSAAADWIVNRSKPEKLTSLLELLLLRECRPRGLPPWADMLSTALTKDKRGFLFKYLVEHSWSGPDHLQSLVELIARDRALLRNVAVWIPSLMSSKAAPSGLLEFMKRLVSATVAAEGPTREQLSAALVSIASRLLLMNTTNDHELLDITLRASRQLRNITTKDETKRRTWVFENLGAPEERPKGLLISVEGARQLAIAFQKAFEGFTAHEILTMTAHNLGLTPIGEQNEEVIYDPLRHEDTEGGMLPGERAHIQQTGWICGLEVIGRAKVRKES